MAQNTTRESDIRFANLVIDATREGGCVRRLGGVNGNQDIKLRIAGLFTFTIPKEMLNAVRSGNLLVLGRLGGHDDLDIPLAPLPHQKDERISGIQCIIRSIGLDFVVYDCSVNGTELVN